MRHAPADVHLGRGGVHESAPYAEQWRQLQSHSSHVKVAKSCTQGNGLFWKPQQQYWPAGEPLYVYGGFEVPDGCMHDLSKLQKDYLLHVPNSKSYICGEPWHEMPGTHVGGYASHPTHGHPCTVVTWIPIERMMPRTMHERLVQRGRGVLRETCGAMAIPIVHALRSAPDQSGELKMSYGSDAEVACPGIKRSRQPVPDGQAPA